MWQLSNPALVASEPGNGAPIAAIATGTAQAPLCQVDYWGDRLDPLIEVPWTPATAIATVPAFTGNQVTLDLSGSDLVEVLLIQAANQTFAIAEDPENPQPGEFIWNPITQAVTLFLNPLVPLPTGLQVQIVGGSERVSTGVISPSLINALRGLPVKGQLNISMGAEQHPNATLSLFTSGNTIHALRSRFRKGHEITIADVGFSVAEFGEELMNTSDYPGLFYAVTISLTGKWARSKYNELSFFDRGAANSTSQSEQAFSDPSCTLQLSGAGKGQLKSKTVTVSQLARQVGARFSGPGRWRVPVPENAPGNAATQWTAEMQNLLRQNSCYVDFNSPGAVKARSLNGSRFWSYRVPAITISYQGDCERSPDHRGYGFEYKNATLDGSFLELLQQSKKEPTQGPSEDLRPRWKRRKPLKQTVPSGTKNPPPPADARILNTLSLNWDVSGDTAEYSETDLEDGSPMRIRRWIYGWAYTADQIANSDGELAGAPGAYWGVVEYRESVYQYDPEFRVLVQITTRGWCRRRFLQEDDDQLQTINEDGDRRHLYRHGSLPIFEVSRFLYGQFYDFYKDYATAEQPRYVIYQVPTRAGVCEERVAYDPNWKPALFLMEELHYSNTYASAENPDSTADDPLPRLIVGEERQSRRRITILPSANTRRQLGGSVEEREQDDRYKEESWESAPQGPGFLEQSGRGQEAISSGKPAEAQTLPPLYELVEPEEEERKTQPSEQEDEIEYRLTTRGWSTRDPIGGSYSAPYAKSVAQAFESAKANLKVQDILSSVRYRFEVPFNLRLRPFDRLQVSTASGFYPTRIVSVSHEIAIDTLAGEPLLTTISSKVEAGIDRSIPVNLSKIKRPKRPKPRQRKLSILLIRYADLTVGNILPTTVRTRRNPYGRAS